MLATDNDADNDCFRINTWGILPSRPGVSRSGEEREQVFLGLQRSFHWEQSSCALSSPGLE